ncbi:MAG: GNAT family N-acetyltransferase [Clostridia bacterium]
MEKNALRQLQGEEARKRVAPLFDGWDETLIWSVLQGCMGTLWCLEDACEPPSEAVCEIGDFLFVAGNADTIRAERLLHALSRHVNGKAGILVPQSKAWEPKLEAAFEGRYKRCERYAICKDAHCFDVAHLQAMVNALDRKFTIAPIDGELYERLLQEEWSRDFCAVFGSAENYMKNGLGFVALCNQEPVGGASSYTYYNGGIEIEVDTRRDLRRQGIACACCAKLILTCLERGLYPSWDAANRASVQLAQKLGYCEQGAYCVYEVNDEQKDEG